jgi:fructokinase
VEVVSTVGAGDNFNAGVVYGLLSAAVERDSLASLSKNEWCRIIACGLDFSAHACTLIENYVDKEWATNYRNEKF